MAAKLILVKHHIGEQPRWGPGRWAAAPLGTFAPCLHCDVDGIPFGDRKTQSATKEGALHATRDCRRVLLPQLSTMRWWQDGRGAGRGDREGAAHRSRCNLTLTLKGA